MAIRFVYVNGEMIEQGNHNLLYSRKGNPYSGGSIQYSGINAWYSNRDYPRLMAHAGRNPMILFSYWPISENLHEKLKRFLQDRV